MNIFYLDKNPILAAKYHNDKHCVKMIVEMTQLLSTAHNVLDGEDDRLYKTTHINHPSAKWVRYSKQTYLWTYSCLKALVEEWKLRYNHKDSEHHKCESLFFILQNPPKNISDNGFIEPYLAITEKECIKSNAVDSYRSYYMVSKRHLAKWRTGIPYWFE